MIDSNDDDEVIDEESDEADIQIKKETQKVWRICKIILKQEIYKEKNQEIQSILQIMMKIQTIV